MTAQIFDLTDKLEQSENHLGRGSFVSSIDGTEKTEDKLTKASKDRLQLRSFVEEPRYLFYHVLPLPDINISSCDKRCNGQIFWGSAGF